MAKAHKHGTEDSTLATNHKARRDYEVIESFEAGIELKGPEIKSIRRHRVNIDDSFARIDEGELYLYNMHVSPYEQGNRYNVEPTRVRRLLMHRREIDRLSGLLSRKRVALIALRLYQKRGFAKVELALGKGKRVFEKRDRLRERDSEIELRRTLRDRQRRKDESA